MATATVVQLLTIVDAARHLGISRSEVTIVDRFITSDEIRTRFPDLVQRAHTGGVALITDDLDAALC